MPQFFRFCLWKFLGQSDMWVELEGLARGEFVLCEQVSGQVMEKSVLEKDLPPAGLTLVTTNSNTPDAA